MRLVFNPATVDDISAARRWGNALDNFADLAESQPPMTVPQIFACLRRALRVTGWDCAAVQRSLLEPPEGMTRDDAVVMLRTAAELQSNLCEQRQLQGDMTRAEMSNFLT